MTQEFELSAVQLAVKKAKLRSELSEAVADILYSLFEAVDLASWVHVLQDDCEVLVELCILELVFELGLVFQDRRGEGDGAGRGLHRGGGTKAEA